MAKYQFIFVLEKELTHEEINDLEYSLHAQIEDFSVTASQLVEVTPKETPPTPKSTCWEFDDP